MFIRKHILFLYLLFSFFQLNGQDSLSVKEKQKPAYDTTDLHSPQRAVRLSLMLPGAGQIYNSKAMPKGKKHAWWKVPLIYAALGGSAYLLVENHVLQRDLRAEYEYRMDNNGTPNPENPEFFEFDMPGILTLYEGHKGTRDMAIILFAASYGLNLLDALVEAHFVDFDVSDDLTLKVVPQLQQHNTFGVSLSLKFK